MEAIFIPVAALCAWLIGEKVATKACPQTAESCCSGEWNTRENGGQQIDSGRIGGRKCSRGGENNWHAPADH